MSSGGGCSGILSGKGCKGGNVARPRKELTDDDIRRIKIYAGYGLSLNQIAAILGMSPTTLRIKRNEKRVSDALLAGQATAEGIIGEALFKRAKVGDVPAIRWWEMTRAKRRATQPEGDDGTTAQRMNATLSAPDDFAITFVSVAPKDPLLTYQPAAKDMSDES